jgi:hypothetical protein
MPRYVILQHDHPVLHWDLMLESGDVLRTWRLSEPPQPLKELAATSTFDHRRIYLDYEGPVSGNRGQVARWDYGTFAWQQIQSDRLAVNMHGVRLHGCVILEQKKGDQWSLTYVNTHTPGA